MAEEIKLVGNFTDNITPKLRKLSKALDDVSKSFTKIQKKLRPITKEMGRLAMASERVANSLMDQKKAIDSNSRSWSNYKKEVGQAAGAQRKAFRNMPRGGMAAPRMPKTANVPGSPAARRASGGGGGGAFVGGGTAALAGVGYQLSNLVIGGIVKGFEIGTNLLQMPFKFFMNGLGERIQDEMSDIKAAGGIFAISKRMDDPLVRSFAEAESLTKETNRYLAELAGALPGDTQQYIQVAKQISDSIGQIISNDKAASLEIGKQLAMTRGADTTIFDGGGQAALQAAFKEMTGELTKQTVLASGGSKMGAMGLPQLTEQMISQDNLTTGMFRRYSAVFRDPQIMSALERNLDNINKTAKSSGARFQAIQKMYEEVVTPEYVRRVQRSTEGVVEAMRTTFMNPEVGLLGLGRPVELAGKASNDLSIKFDHFGRMLDKNNKVTTDVTKAVRESLSLFEYLRDIFANLMIVLQPVMDALTSLYDPFVGLARELDGLRKATMAFQLSFEQANVMLDNAAKDLKGEALKNFNTSKSLRASLMAVTKGFMELGAFSTDEAFSNVDMLMDPNTTSEQLQEMITVMIDKFLNSVAGFKIGGTLGRIIGKVLKTFADILTGIFGDKTLKNQFVTGFVDGFKGAGGSKAIEDIFYLVFDKLRDIVEVVLDKMKELAMDNPQAAALVAGVAVGPMLLPALPGLIGSIVSGIGGLFTAVGTAGGIGPAIAAGFSTILASPALLAAIIAGLAITAKVTEDVRNDVVLPSLAQSAQERTDAVRGDDGQLRSLQGNGLAGIMDGLMGELTWVVHDFIKGFGDIFTGLYNIVVGAFTDPKMVTEGINQIFSGLWSLFTMIGHLLIAIGYAVPGLIMGILIAIKNLIVGIAMAIAGLAVNLYQMADNAVGGAITNFFTNMANAIGDMWNNRPRWLGGSGGEGEQGSPEYDGKRKMMPLNKAIATEQKNKPPGTDLVIANTSEKIIPAYKGYTPEMSSSSEIQLPGLSEIAANTSPIGMVAAYLKELCAKVDTHGKAAEAKLTEVKSQISSSSSAVQAKMSEVSAKLDAGINVNIIGTPTVIAKMDIAGLGGGSGGPSMFTTAAAGFGLTMTSGYRPGDDDSYHGLDRARDYAGDPASMKQFASFMAATYGSSLKELIYTPLGYSISNGQVVAPYAQGTHYDHVHVAYGMGAGQPAFFKSQREAVAWEKTVAPSNEMVKSVTSHTGETGRGGVDIGGINITVNAETSMDGDDIANLVAGKVLTAVQQATFTELDVT